MIANESIRISKVVKELNIGIGTLVDFLKKKGIDVDPSPNSKLTTEAYLLAQKEFDKEHRLKEQSKKIVFKVVESAREEPVLVEPPTVAVEKPPVVKEPEPAPEYKPEPAVASVVSEPQPTPQTPPIQAPSVQTPPAPPPPAQAPAEEKISGPKVIGKIDLSPKPKPQKDGPRGGKQQKKGQGMPQNRPKPQTRPKPQSEIPVRKLDTKPEETAAPSPAAVQHIETKVQKLTGPTITGNIDLSQFEKKKPTTESSPERRKKGKRERIHKGQREKVDVAKIAAKTRSTGDGKAAERKGKERFKPVRNEVDEDAVQKQIKETYARMVEGKGKTKGSKYRREKRGLVSQRMQEEQERQERQSNVLEVTEFVTVNELATMMQRPVVKVIEACMNLGLMVSINQRLDAEAMVLVAEEFGFEVKFVSVEIQDAVEQVADTEEDLQSRPPIVTVMGHVDHGKTSLLDYIRKSNVIAGEAGGITQHIGAYNVHLPNGRQITFLDTPGHEAFTAMRARGDKVTDLAIIIVAADDAVMPQTIEAINHAVAAGVPMIFAINKIDKPGANSEKIREQLANMNFLVEDWGGKYQCQEISAKQGINMDKLLEKILLEADLLDLKANPRKYAVGTVIESSLDKGRGYLATILIQSGSLRVGDAILSGIYSGRVKAMFNERGQKIEEAGPSMPVSMLGLNGAPTAGELFNVVADEREARDLANKREQLQRIQNIRTQKHITLEEIGRRIAIGNFQQLNVIVKGDVDGSIEALADSLIKLSTEEIQVEVIHKAVGAISESDILLAAASNAIIIGFQVRPSAAARKLAEKEEIEIRLYSVIYDAINEVKSGIEGMLAPEQKEEVTAAVEVRETFKISKVGTIAGCMVKEGKITRNAKIRVIRDGIVVYTGTLGSLKRFKDDVKEVAAGYDCGLNIDGFNDIKISDMIEAYTIVEIKRKLQ
ncbi:MAG: translation initiation factor IF-2 [Bacteroidales bacterium]|nr:translation initiation factor IF-2 [Bacteroidales bacterium]